MTIEARGEERGATEGRVTMEMPTQAARARGAAARRRRAFRYRRDFRFLGKGN
jgi:hypothetical protein